MIQEKHEAPPEATDTPVFPTKDHPIQLTKRKATNWPGNRTKKETETGSQTRTIHAHRVTGKERVRTDTGGTWKS